MMLPRLLLAVVAVMTFAVPPVWAQDTTTGAIVGTVRDTSGGALPGVTVEVASPALIERTRTVVSDGEGLYRVTGLRPGTYSVTFTLSGFRVFVRQGVDVQTGFTATVNAEMALGALEETITVTGAAPLVDTSSATAQTAFSREIIEALPLGKNSGALAAVIPGALGSPANVDVAGTKTEQAQGFSAFGGGTIVIQRDGMYNGLPQSTGQNFTSSNNPAGVQEVAVQISGTSAEAQGGGTQMNFVPREGGNEVSGTFSADFGSARLQSANTKGLASRGAAEAGKIKELWDVNGGIGGPIVRDRLWHFTSARTLENQQFVVGTYFNTTPNTLFYTPDLSRQTYTWNYNRNVMTRLTGQLTQQQKVTAMLDIQRTCFCFNQTQGGIIMPDGASDRLTSPYLLQLGHNYVRGANFLVETRFSHFKDSIAISLDSGDRGPREGAISVFDQTNNRRYGAITVQTGGPGNLYGNTYNRVLQGQVTAAYVTGSHNVKVGTTLRRMSVHVDQFHPTGLGYTFTGGSTPQTAVPTQVTYLTTPWNNHVFIQQHAAFVQDQWRIGRLTVNPGLRFEYMHGYTPEQVMPAGPFVRERRFAPTSGIPRFTDLNLRLGAAWDLFGDGRTALKAALGRYQPPATAGAGSLVDANNPANRTVNSANRSWSDANRDFIPQESELGPLSNVNFGTAVPGRAYADDVLRGFGVAPYSWQGNVSLQHQVLPWLAGTVGYYRTTQGNQIVVDNLLAGPSDYDFFCLNAPSDSRLPDGGGQRLCGINNVRVAGQVSELVRPVSDFGGMTEVYNGVNLTLNARFGRGAFLTGGVNMGRTTTDNCAVQEQLPELAVSPLNCRQQAPWGASTDFKVAGAYVLPGAVNVSATYQNLPGIPTDITWQVPNSVIAPALGRNLSACRAGQTAAQCTATLTVPIVTASSLYREDRVSLLSFSVGRTFQANALTLRPRLEVGNALNANPVTQLNATLGPTFDAVRGVLTPRTLKLALQLEFR